MYFYHQVTINQDILQNKIFASWSFNSHPNQEQTIALYRVISYNNERKPYSHPKVDINNCLPVKFAVPKLEWPMVVLISYITSSIIHFQSLKCIDEHSMIIDSLLVLYVTCQKRRNKEKYCLLPWEIIYNGFASEQQSTTSRRKQSLFGTLCTFYNKNNCRSISWDMTMRKRQGPFCAFLHFFANKNNIATVNKSITTMLEPYFGALESVISCIQGPPSNGRLGLLTWIVTGSGYNSALVY